MSRLIAVLVVFAVGGCKLGGGEGQAAGLVWAEDCGFDGDPYRLDPTFFGADPSERVDVVDIAVQRGAGPLDRRDRIAVNVGAAEEIKTTLLGMDIDLSDRAGPVRMIFSLFDTCGNPNGLAVSYEAVSGTIRFDELFVPWIDDNREVTAVFDNVEFVDHANPTERRAVLSGDFTFFATRGRPTQLFP